MIRQYVSAQKGLFEFTDAREIFVRPVPVDRMMTHPRKPKTVVLRLLAAGRLVGLAVRRGLFPGIPLIRGTLSFFQLPDDSPDDPTAGFNGGGSEIFVGAGYSYIAWMVNICLNGSFMTTL